MAFKSLTGLTHASKVLLRHENYVYRALEPVHAKESL
jgi:hypothetical protein